MKWVWGVTEGVKGLGWRAGEVPVGDLEMVMRPDRVAGCLTDLPFDPPSYTKKVQAGEENV